MGEAAKREKRLKDMTLKELELLISARAKTLAAEWVEQVVKNYLPNLIDTAVKERLVDYHEYLISEGFVRPDDRPDSDEMGMKKEGNGGSRLWLPRR